MHLRDDQRDVLETAERFRAAAADAIGSGDVNEVFNAAADFATQNGMGSSEMFKVLSTLLRQKLITPEVLRAWQREARAALGEERDARAVDTAVNITVQEHGVSVSWEHGPLLAFLADWFRRFNQAFFSSALPPACISIDYAHKSKLGSYTWGRDGLGLAHRVNLNARHLDRPRADVLRTLIHEMVHLWEDVEHGRRAGAARYHTARFRRRSADLGIPCDENGRSLGIVPGGPFAKLLAAHGIGLDEPAVVVASDTPVAKPRKQTLRRWVCACSRAWAARGAELRVVCQRCGEEWRAA